VLDDDLASESLQRLRSGLQESGAYGRFLLAEVDRALALGIEEYDEEVTYDTRGYAHRSGKQSIVRRAPSEAEALLLAIQVLSAYMVDLPAAIVSAKSNLDGISPLANLTVTFRSGIESEQALPHMPDIDLLEFSDSLSTADTRGSLQTLYAMVAGTEPESEDAATIS
jgi:hypothetical protein